MSEMWVTRVEDAASPPVHPGRYRPTPVSTPAVGPGEPPPAVAPSALRSLPSVPTGGAGPSPSSAAPTYTSALAPVALDDDSCRLVVEVASQAIFVLDDEGRVRFANPATAALLRRARDELIGVAFSDLVDDRHEAEERFWRATSGVVDHGDLRLHRGDSSRVWASLVFHPVRRDDGRTEIVCFANDVTHLRELERASLETAERYRRLHEHSADIIVVLDDRGGVKFFSPSGTEQLGYELGFDPEGGIFALVHPVDLEAALGAFVDMVEGRRGPDDLLNLRIRAKGGEYRWYEARGQNLIDDPTIEGIVITARDITRRLAAEAAQRKAEQVFEVAFDRAPQGIAVLSLDGVFTEANRACADLLGVDGHALQGAAFTDLLVPGDREPSRAEFERLGCGCTETLSIEVRVVSPSRWVLVDASLVCDDGAPSCIVCQVVDITERKQYQEELEHHAAHDPLTGLANRLLLVESLEQACGRGSRRDGAVGVLCVDLDGFKEVNDTFGHAAGDEVLVQVAQRLRRSLRIGDVVFRLGGDEFVVLCEDLPSSEHAMLVAARICATMRRPFDVSAGTVTIGASVGVAVTTGSDAAPDLLAAADGALYESKRAGRDRATLAPLPPS